MDSSRKRVEAVIRCMLCGKDVTHEDSEHECSFWDEAEEITVVHLDNGE